MMAMALTSKTHPYKAGFGALPGDRLSYPLCVLLSLLLLSEISILRFVLRAALGRYIQRVVASEDVAAVIAEPVLGRRWIRCAAAGFL
jgi:4-aminobutyrate aminotransferase-like enzyme